MLDKIFRDLWIYWNDFFTTVSDQTKKQQIISRSILTQLKEATDSFTRIELYTLIYESGNVNLMRNLSVIDVSVISLSRDQAHIVGSLIAKTGRLEALNLSKSNINDDDLHIIAKYVIDHIQVCNDMIWARQNLTTASYQQYVGSQIDYHDRWRRWAKKEGWSFHSNGQGYFWTLRPKGGIKVDFCRSVVNYTYLMPLPKHIHRYWLIRQCRK